MKNKNVWMPFLCDFFRYSILEDNSLCIRQVTQDDEGVYVCEAVNSNGRVLDDMMLTVSGKSLAKNPYE